MAFGLVQDVNNYNYCQSVYNDFLYMPCRGRRYMACNLKTDLHVIAQDNSFTKLDCFLKHYHIASLQENHNFSKG